MLKTLLFTLCLTVATFLNAQTITTIAGTASVGYFGDGGPANAASLNGPFAVATDNRGNVFIADRLNHRIRKIDHIGIITTIAGTGVAGYSGDNGPATLAQLNDPTGVAADTMGNLYIADRNNNRIRKINTGVITTICGDGTRGFGGDGGPSWAAKLNGPRSVMTDVSGNIYVADQGNNRIRKIDTSGMITTIAGTGTQGFSGDGGPATDAQLYNPAGMAMSENSALFFADVDNERVRKIETDGTISTVAGTGTTGFSGDNGPATAAQLYEPYGVATDKHGNCFVADAWNQRIRMIAASGQISTIAGTGMAGYSGDGGPALSCTFNNGYGIATDSSGAIYVADYTNSRVRKITAFTAVNELQTDISFAVYPNPSLGHITVSIANPSQSGTLIFTNMAGVIVYAAPISAQKSLEVELANGVYLVSYSNGIARGWHQQVVILR